MYRTDRDRALSLKFIEACPTTLVNVLTVDIDAPAYDSAEWSILSAVYDDHAAPLPSWYTVNRDTGHAHASYRLRIPATSERTREYAEDVRQKLSRRLQGDPFYGGRVTRNPLHPSHYSQELTAEPYTLSELSQFLKANPSPTDKEKRAHTPQADRGEGRNVATMEDVRHYAYSWKINNPHASSGQLHTALSEYAHAVNELNAPPLPVREVEAIAKSAAKFTASKFTAAKFSDIQSRRAKKRETGRGTYARYLQALELYEVGGLRAISKGLNLNPTTTAARSLLNRARKWYEAEHGQKYTSSNHAPA